MKQIPALAKLGIKHTRNAIAEFFYLKFGLDYTKPVSFYGFVNERCNAKCLSCHYWRLNKYKEEMTIEQWQNALLSIKDFVGSYSINFSGGEPFLKKGFIDLMKFCHENKIYAGVTTNGSTLNRENAAKIVATHPLNINISCDAPNAKIHDYLRGFPGLFDRLSTGIKYLIEEKNKQNIEFPIVIKPTISKVNFRLLPDIVTWAKSIGANAVNFQPFDIWTEESKSILWIKEEKDLEELKTIIEKLIIVKKEGAPIVNSENILRLIPANFRNEKAPKTALPCRIGLRSYYIFTDGDVSMCLNFPGIGNVKDKSAKEIWYCEKAKKIRRATIKCEKLCLLTCLSQKTLIDKAKMALNIFAKN